MELTVIGTVFVDIKGYPSGGFVPAGRNAGRVEQFHGGVGRNIAEDVANLGIDTTFISLVDEGGIGADVVSHLRDCGINTGYVRTSPDGMGTWLAIFDESGEVYANMSRRSVLLPLCQVLDAEGGDIFSHTDGILLEIDIEEEVVAKVFELADRYEKPVYAVISNISIALERMDYIRRSRCFVCNRQEAEVFFEACGISSSEEASPDQVLAIMQDRSAEIGLRAMVVTMAADGAAYADYEKGEFGLCPAQPVKVIDTTGAGDSFFAGVSVGLSGGDSMADACRLGAEMAAKVISGEGNVYEK